MMSFCGQKTERPDESSDLLGRSCLLESTHAGKKGGKNGNGGSKKSHNFVGKSVR